MAANPSRIHGIIRQNREKTPPIGLSPRIVQPKPEKILRSAQDDISALWRCHPERSKGSNRFVLKQEQLPGQGRPRLHRGGKLPPLRPSSVSPAGCHLPQRGRLFAQATIPVPCSLFPVPCSLLPASPRSAWQCPIFINLTRKKACIHLHNVL